MSLLSVEELHLSFKGIKALQGVSLDVREQELVAVIGPNGAGKTSLFNCICGVYKPQQGSISFDGQDLLGLQPHAIAARGVARMFQNLTVFDQMTTLENLMLGRHHLGRSNWFFDLVFWGRGQQQEVQHRAKVEEIIDFLHLERYRETPAGILPYGVLKRIELGRALCMEPKLLLLDEPAAGLNQEETEDLARYILDIRDELGVALVLIEHDLRFVMELADQVTVLDFGKHIASGPPAEVRQHPAVIEAYVGGGH